MAKEIKEIVSSKSDSTLGKIPGDQIGVAVTFIHKGVAGTCYVSLGISPGTDWPLQHDEDHITWLIRNTPVSVGNDADWKMYTKALISTFPDIAIGEGTLRGNYFDGYLTVAYNGKVIASQWVDDVYFREDLVESLFKDIIATFS